MSPVGTETCKGSAPWLPSQGELLGGGNIGVESGAAGEMNGAKAEVPIPITVPQKRGMQFISVPLVLHNIYFST